MNEQKREIVRKYLLPERPFLFGMASAFDLFGLLDQGRSEQVLVNLREDLRALERKRARSVWPEIGETLYWAMKKYEKEAGESIRE
ncbi:MAG: hypothetical protein OXN88_17710 [Chloroflexota bacterium]|nr:hypothetical protein [Chloroflexota bacterium]